MIVLREAALPDALVMCESPEHAANYWNQVIATDPRHNECVESFYVLHLNTRKRVTGHHLVATGTLDTLFVHAREVFRTAIVANAGSIILMHNHPSGDSTPSDADIKVTRDLVSSGRLLKIEVVDHVIVGRPSVDRHRWYHSLQELGYFY